MKHVFHFFVLLMHCMIIQNMLFLAKYSLNTANGQLYLRVLVIRAWLQAVLVYGHFLLRAISVVTLWLGEGSHQRIVT